MRQFSYAKALVFVALATWSATSVTEGAINSHALRALNASVPIKRGSKKDAGMASSVHTVDSEERASMSNIGLKLEESISRHFTYMLRTTPHDEPFRSRYFLKGVNVVATGFPHLLDTAKDNTFNLIHHHFGEDLASVLLAGRKIDGTKRIAEKWLDKLVQKWLEDRMSAAYVYKQLQLDQAEGNNLRSTLGLRYFGFVEARIPGTGNKYMFKKYYIKYGDDLASILVAGTKIDGTRRIAGQWLQRLIWKWVYGNKSFPFICKRLEHLTYDDNPRIFTAFAMIRRNLPPNSMH